MSLQSDALLATSGVFGGQITPAEHAKAQAMPEAWTRRLRSWVRSDEPKPFDYREPKDLDKLWTQLAVEPMQDEVAGWIDGLGYDVTDLIGEYFASFKRAREWILAQWPKWATNGPAGPKVLPLSFDDAAEMWSLIQVIDDPDRILDEMDALTLTPSQAEGFRICYPDLSEHARQALQDEMTVRLARNKDWEPSADKEAVLRTFMGLPPEEVVAPPPPPAPEPKGFEIDSDRERTQAEVSSAPKGGK